MPDRRRHRGPHPEDDGLFAVGEVPRLAAAVADLSWLLSHDYADAAALKLVGDRFGLAQRQRVAVRRCACADAQRDRRAATRREVTKLTGATVCVDGFNVLTTVEAALAGGVLLAARDGCIRDMASMHGSWKRVAETERAARLLCSVLAQGRPSSVTVVLDRPVANSGRLAAVLRNVAAELLPVAQVALRDGADRALVDSGAIVATADSGILDRVAQWVDIVRPALLQLTSAPRILDLAAPPTRPVTTEP